MAYVLSINTYIKYPNTKMFFRISSITVLFCFLFFISCAENNDTISEQEEDENLLINSSFEINGNPSLEGWFVQDTLSVTFENNTPPDGGNWSISLEANWGPPFSISSTVAAKQGTYQYHLSFWSKILNVRSEAFLNLKQNDTLTVRESVVISDTSWTLYSILDTISATESDSIVVILTGGFSQLIYGKTYFDLCKLEIID